MSISSMVRAFRGKALSRFIIAALSLWGLTFFDPLDLKSSSSLYVRDGLTRILRTVPPDEAILTWSDDRVRNTAYKVWGELDARTRRLEWDGKGPHAAGIIPSKANLSYWSPIHLFMFNEETSNMNRTDPEKLDHYLTGIPLDDLTGKFRSLARAGVSLIYLDIRIINDMSYNANFCDETNGVVKAWGEVVQSPTRYKNLLKLKRQGAGLMGDQRVSFEREFQKQYGKELRKPVLLIAGHGPSAIPDTFGLLNRQQELAKYERERVQQTVLPCLNKIAEVVQTDWRFYRDAYPITVDATYDPWKKTSIGDRVNSIAQTYSPAMRMFQIWCGHHRSVVRGLDTCDWAKPMEAAQMPWPSETIPEHRREGHLIPDWVHLRPSVYTKEDAAMRCGEINESDDEDYRHSSLWQNRSFSLRFAETFNDMMDQTVLQIMTPVVAAHARTDRSTCFLPAYWNGFLGARHRPWERNRDLQSALYGTAVVIGGAYETRLNWVHSATAGQVPTAFLHALALQSLMWRGQDFVRDTNVQWNKYSPSQWWQNSYFWLELGSILTAVAGVAFLRKVKPNLRTLSSDVRIEPYSQFLDFLGIATLVILAAVLLSKYWLFIPVPDAIAIVVCLGVAYLDDFKRLGRRSILCTVKCVAKLFTFQIHYLWYYFLLALACLLTSRFFYHTIEETTGVGWHEVARLVVLVALFFTTTVALRAVFRLVAASIIISRKRLVG